MNTHPDQPAVPSGDSASTADSTTASADAAPERFTDFSLPAPILRGIESAGYERPSPIQRRSIPPLLAGRDLLGEAQTGTGKTAAFVLPALAGIDLAKKSPQVLILTPTRELAIQVAETTEAYGRHLEGLRVLPIYGGQAYGLQLRPLRRGVHVVVGTPGRVIDHLERKTLGLDAIRTIVLDEADEMLKMGFLEDVTKILGQAPAERQVALFSATMPPAIRTVADEHLRDPAVVRIEEPTVTASSIHQRYCAVQGRAKRDALTRVAEVEDFDAMLVFVRTRAATAEVSEHLETAGYSAAPLNGDMSQQARERTVRRLRERRLDIIVATDVAARGLDVERITHVLNYDAPRDTEAYVHRIGRTGRAGRVGEAILFLERREKRLLRAIERVTRQSITPFDVPDDAAIQSGRIAAFKQRIAKTLERGDLDFFVDLIDECERDLRAKPNRIAAALASLAQEGRPLRVDRRAGKRPTKKSKDRSERGEGREGPDSTDGKDTRSKAKPGMVRYRIEVGRGDGATAKDVVEAISGEAELEPRFIGPVQLREHHAFVDLPEGMPRPLFRHLKRVSIHDRLLRITRAGPGK